MADEFLKIRSAQQFPGLPGKAAHGLPFPEEPSKYDRAKRASPVMA